MDDLDLGATLKGFTSGQKVFGRYTLKKILGRGGMGVVWLASDDELGRETALKFLPEVVAADRASIDDMKREVRRAIGLAHPHIVKIHDFVTDGRTAAVSMEYVAGSTLSSLRVDEPSRILPLAKLTPWVRQLCQALEYAHADAEVVHRDLKPANLMVDGRGKLKILDFGIAASISDSVSRVSAQVGSSGTPVYMSPQQMMGEKPAVTDDLYALGATIYELLTAKPPFHSGNVMMQVQNKVPPPMTERRKELGVEGEPIPAEWEAAVAACLAKEPKDRPADAMDLWRRLSEPTSVASPVPALVAGAADVSVPVVTPVGVTPLISSLRRKVKTLGGSALLLALGGCGLMLCWRWASNWNGEAWEGMWRWVEYSMLVAWTTGSIALVRRALPREIALGSWLGLGVMLVTLNIGFSELGNAALNGSNVDQPAFVNHLGPPVMGMLLALGGMTCFVGARPRSVAGVAVELLLGLGLGVVAAMATKLPVLPSFIHHSVVLNSWPPWVVMGSLTWLYLVRLVLGLRGFPAAGAPPRWRLIAGVVVLIVITIVVVAKLPAWQNW
ncbi:MAG: serine/threonine-protein kinase [Lacunisphaera sp.]|nr:serine/threonine-protein kinase [Lacunisphaera sp.]